MADNSITVALTGKLLPQTVVFFVMATFYNVYLYGFLHYPCNSGILPMLFAGLLLVLASQAFGVFLFGLFTTVRLALSTASLSGGDFFLHIGYEFSGYGNESCITGTGQSIPVTPLLPDLCRFGT